MAGKHAFSGRFVDGGGGSRNQRPRPLHPRPGGAPPPALVHCWTFRETLRPGFQGAGLSADLGGSGGRHGGAGNRAGPAMSSPSPRAAATSLSYLTADPARDQAVDLNTAHIALNRLKLAAARHLPDYAGFLPLLRQAPMSSANIAAYRALSSARISTPRAAALLGGARLIGRRRIAVFARGVYRRGLLGWFIGVGASASRGSTASTPRGLLKARHDRGAARLSSTRASRRCSTSAWSAG